MFRDAAVDLTHLSPRRVWALAWLAVKESIRRRVVVVFAVFIVILLFAGWFLDPGSADPARLYLSFVLTATSYLVLLLALFLSSLSLPADIKNRTLHTVVTKPVRRSEIVLGRILGFTAVGTALLLVMGRSATCSWSAAWPTPTNCPRPTAKRPSSCGTSRPGPSPAKDRWR